AAPSSPEPHYLRGLFWLARDNLFAAEQELGAATRASPNEPRFLLATLWLRRKQYESSSSTDVSPVSDAAERLGRVARTPNELNGAADMLRATSKLDEALPLAQRAAALAPFDPEILDTYANILFDLGRVSEAVEVQTAAVSFMDEHTQDEGILFRLERYKSAL